MYKIVVCMASTSFDICGHSMISGPLAWGILVLTPQMHGRHHLDTPTVMTLMDLQKFLRVILASGYSQYLEESRKMDTCCRLT
jgi:hypothetical protein